MTKSIKDAGILDMQFYLMGNRMFMIMESEKWIELEKVFQLENDETKS